MKQIIIGTIIVTALGGGYLLADDSYNNKVKDAVTTISANLKDVGYNVNYTKINSSILDDYISIDGVSLDKDGETIEMDNLSFHRDSFGDESNKNPKMIEFSIDKLKLSDSFGYKGTSDIYYTYKFNDNNNSFISKLDIKNKDLANVLFSINLKNADNAWNCINENIEDCKISMNPEDIKKALGNVSVNSIKLDFTNNGLIENKLNNIQDKELKMDDLKGFSTNAITNSTIKEENKISIIRFINALDHIGVELKQKENENIQGIVIGFLDKMKKGEFKNEKDFSEYFLNQFDITVK